MDICKPPIVLCCWATQISRSPFTWSRVVDSTVGQHCSKVDFGWIPTSTRDSHRCLQEIQITGTLIARYLDNTFEQSRISWNCCPLGFWAFDSPRHPHRTSWNERSTYWSLGWRELCLGGSLQQGTVWFPRESKSNPTSSQLCVMHSVLLNKCKIGL